MMKRIGNVCDIVKEDIDIMYVSTKSICGPVYTTDSMNLATPNYEGVLTETKEKRLVELAKLLNVRLVKIDIEKRPFYATDSYCQSEIILLERVLQNRPGPISFLGWAEGTANASIPKCVKAVNDYVWDTVFPKKGTNEIILCMHKNYLIKFVCLMWSPFRREIMETNGLFKHKLRPLSRL